MTRVTENSNSSAVSQGLTQTKRKLEKLQLQGSNLKRISKPSDDPIGNVDLMALRSRLSNGEQMVRNLHYAKSYLEFTENSLVDLSDILAKAKEIAIAQSSDTFSHRIRQNIAQEVDQLFKQSLAIANKNIGHKYIFSGYATHQRPFDGEGNYHGDGGHTFVEISRDFFIPTNLTGEEIFFNSSLKSLEDNPLEKTLLDRTIATTAKAKDKSMGQEKEVELRNKYPTTVNDRNSIFDLLRGLRNSLNSGSSGAVQNLLEGLDEAANRIITLRTQVGSIYNVVTRTEVTLSNDKIITMAEKGRIEDADVTDLYSELGKQQNILKAAYKSGTSLLEGGLIDFLR